MKKARSKYRILSVIMTVLVLLVSLPTYAFATLIDNTNEVYSSEEASIDTAIDSEKEASKAELLVLEELVPLREENVKHFKLSDGTTKAVAYASPVHYKDADGNWIDIDNSLTLNGSEYTANNKTEIKFANKSGSSGLISIKDGEYKIDFTPLNTNKISVEIENPQGNNSRKFDDIKKLTNLISKATYKNIYDGIDLEYILIGNNIKENIIVNEKQDTYSYSFEIKLNKLSAELIDNSIVLSDSDTGEQIYEIPAPYMLDDNGAYSNDVEYSLVQNNKWKYTLTVTANADWINSEERAFPVTIDPTVVSGTPTKEIFVMEGEGVEDDLPYLIVGNFMGFYYDIPAFIKFDALTTIADGAKLIDAKLNMYISYIQNQTDEDFKIGVYPATANWYSPNTNGQYSISYNNLNSYYDSTQLIDCLFITDEKAYSWNITELYKNWLSGTTTNQGICIKGIGLPTQNDNIDTSQKIANVRIETTQNTGNYMIPTIELTYTNIVGYEDYYAYIENDLGTMGHSYVNAYNGSLTYINHLTSVSCQSLRYDINIIYNSIDENWKPSFAENIADASTMEYEQYVWTDEDGTPHAFKPYLQKNSWGTYVSYEQSSTGQLWEVNNPTVFYPENDINYVLIQTENNEFILRDYEGNQKMFDSNGRLLRICDAQGNVLHFEYLNGRLSNICTYNGETKNILVSLDYYSNGMLGSLRDSTNDSEIILTFHNLVVDDKTYVLIDQISYVIPTDETREYFELLNQVQFIYDDTTGNIRLIIFNEVQKIIYFYEENRIVEVQHQLDDTILSATGIMMQTSEYSLLELDDDSVHLYLYTFDQKGRKDTLSKGTSILNLSLVERYEYDDNQLPNSVYYTISYSEKIFETLPASNGE